MESNITTKLNYKLGMAEYATKSEVTAAYRAMLNSYNLGESLDRDDSSRLYYLLLEHPSAHIKMGKRITSIIVDTAMHGTRCFYLLYDDGTKDDFSYTQCISNMKKNNDK